MRLLHFGLLALVYSLVSGQDSADRCDPNTCRLPDCYCGGSDIPGGYKPEDIPQFVLLTFDDAVNDLNEAFFKKLFKGRTNPNGCPIKVIIHILYYSHARSSGWIFRKDSYLYHPGHPSPAVCQVGKLVHSSGTAGLLTVSCCPKRLLAPLGVTPPFITRAIGT